MTDLWYLWGDQTWIEDRRRRHVLGAPMAIYEVHLGSWMRVPAEGNCTLTYRELAPMLADYAHDMGFTHVEFLPMMEHPFYASWSCASCGRGTRTPPPCWWCIIVRLYHGSSTT